MDNSALQKTEEMKEEELNLSEPELSQEKLERLETEARLFKKIMMSFVVALVLGIGIFILVQYNLGNITKENVAAFIKNTGSAGLIVFTVFQCIRTVFCVIPATIGYWVGPILFGPVYGIIANYVACCLGSFITFCITRKYGDTFMKTMFSEKQYKKAMKWFDHGKNYPLLLWVIILIPVSPDDFFCYFSGLVKNLSFKKFVFVILTSKPWFIIIEGIIAWQAFNVIS